jgi:hypothetical protein
MIFIKIYFTLIFINAVVAVIATWIMNVEGRLGGNEKRENLWYKISSISWCLLLIMIIGGALISTLFDSIVFK